METLSRDIHVIILAAGQQTRWEKNREFSASHKQLLDVGGETIINRIIRQCRNRGVEPVVVTVHPEIEKRVDVECFKPMRHRWTAETLLEFNWGEQRTIVLLGDVVYSWTVMNRIFSYDGLMRVFGSVYEIFALSFHPISTWFVIQALESAIEHAKRGGPGKLRKFYQAYCGLDLDSDGMEDRILDRVCWIQDYTRDVDTPRDYKELLNKVVRGGLLDERIP